MSYNRNSPSQSRTTIAGAPDSALSSPAHNQYLAYNTSLQTWQNIALTSTDVAGLQDAIDARISAVTGYAAGGSTGVSVSVVNANGQATLSWSSSSSITGLSGWKVGRDGTDSNGSGPWSTTDPASSSSRVFTNLVNGTTYTLSVAPVVNGTVGTAVTIAAHPA